MRATEIIRGVLDLIDQVETAPTETSNPTAAEYYDDETRRFDQISDLIDTDAGTYDNSPADAIASIETVTIKAGGGTNAPKHPADIRADSIAMYPGTQHVN
jgi:hypothetical protein